MSPLKKSLFEATILLQAFVAAVRTMNTLDAFRFFTHLHSDSLGVIVYVTFPSSHLSALQASSYPLPAPLHV